jgi:hypothetical protein
MTIAEPAARPEPPSDTSPAAEAFVIERFRHMPPEEKLRRVLDLGHSLEVLARARIRATYGPEVPEREIRLRLGALAYGRDLMVQVFGWDPEKEGW